MHAHARTYTHTRMHAHTHPHTRANTHTPHTHHVTWKKLLHIPASHPIHTPVLLNPSSSHSWQACWEERRRKGGEKEEGRREGGEERRKRGGEKEEGRREGGGEERRRREGEEERRRREGHYYTHADQVHIHLCPPLCCSQCFQCDPAEQIGLHILYPRSVQAADHMHPAVEQNGIVLWNGMECCHK